MITAPMQPWLITLEAYRELCTVNFQAPAQGNAVDEKAQPYEVRDGLATVRIHGTMLRQVSPRQKAISAICGVRLCSMEETASALLQAAADPAVHTILLDIDSPGGTVNGTPELAQVVRIIAKDKHVYTFTAGQCCSAAYWVASQADVIYATPSATVGSIGVILPVVDNSALYDRCGLKMEVFSAGKYKSTGMDGTSLTEEQRNRLTQQVNDTCCTSSFYSSWNLQVTFIETFCFETSSSTDSSSTIAAEASIVAYDFIITRPLAAESKL